MNLLAHRVQAITRSILNICDVRVYEYTHKCRLRFTPCNQYTDQQKSDLRQKLEEALSYVEGTSFKVQWESLKTNQGRGLVTLTYLSITYKDPA